MITKVVHGWRPGRLVRYLLGPGRHNEHVHPRVVATWDGRDQRWQPATGPRGLQLRPLIDALHAPAVAAGLPLHEPAPGSRWQGRRGYVWHCSVRNTHIDRILSDQQWCEVARELLHGAGIAGYGDHGGPRWVAIRHAADHIHLVAVLVRQDTARRFWPRNDFRRLRAVAGELERRYGLEVTAAPDRTAPRASARGELEKARRTGREPARVELARAVRHAAVRAHTPETFAAALRQRGYLVELRRAPSGDPIGYKVARPGDLNPVGEPVYYGGSKLAPDLSLPRLIRRWASVPASAGPPPDSPERRLAVLTAATQRSHQAASAVRAGQPGEDPEGIAHATGDLLTALGAVSDGDHPGGPLCAAADRYTRAARPPSGRTPPLGPIAAELRGLAWRLIALGRLHHTEQPAAMLLAVAITALVLEIAAWHQARGRPAQARAARHAARLTSRWSPATPRSPGTGGLDRPDPTAGWREPALPADPDRAHQLRGP